MGFTRRRCSVIWMDYLLAVLVGSIGMLGLCELTFDIVALNTEAYQMTLAGLILSETVALFRLGITDGSPWPHWCAALPIDMRDSHCGVLSDWLGLLTQSDLRITPDGLIVLGWLSPSGNYLQLTQTLGGR